MRLLAAETVLFLGTVICMRGCVTACLTDQYKREGIIPEVLDKAPKQLLQVIYNGKTFGFGQELTPTEVKDAPSIIWNFDPSSYYTLIMNDPDAPGRDDHSLGECIHWMVVNIPGDDFGKGEWIMHYLASGPPLTSGVHRYTFTVFEQPGKLQFDEKHSPALSVEGRFNFSLRKFVEKYNLGDPIAGNMYTCQYDESVPAYLKQLGVDF